MKIFPASIVYAVGAAAVFERKTLRVVDSYIAIHHHEEACTYLGISPVSVKQGMLSDFLRRVQASMEEIISSTGGFWKSLKIDTTIPEHSRRISGPHSTNYNRCREKTMGWNYCEYNQTALPLPYRLFYGERLPMIGYFETD